MSTPLLQVNDLKKHFPIHGGFFGGVTGHVYAVDGVSFDIAQGRDAVAGRQIRLRQVHRGQGAAAAVPAHRRAGDPRRPADRRHAAGTLRPLRRRMQVVFQDPFSSLNPRMRVRDILAEPIRNFGLAKNGADLEARLADADGQGPAAARRGQPLAA